MIQIQLVNNRGYTLIDDDFNYLENYRWHLSGSGYANNNKLGLLHRYIMNCPDDKIVDHINRNRLDNRLNNLRIVTVKENNLNKSKPHENKDIKRKFFSVKKEVYKQFKNYCEKNHYFLNGKLEQIIKYYLKNEHLIEKALKEKGE